MSQNQPILRLAGLLKKFNGFTALDSVDLSVSEGEFLAIVGPSGSGKTTLIRLLVGMDEQTDGTIWLRDERLDTVPANERPTCMVFQSLALFPHRTVGQNIEFPLKIRKVDAARRKERALELLNLLRLPEHYYDRRINECSGGERQRIALARALAFDPEILFFDEPLSALDYRLRKTLEKELKDLHQRTGKTFIYITHSLEEAMVMSDRIAIMRKGQFEQIGPGEEIYARPQSRFVAEFMGEVNLFPARPGEGAHAFEGLAVDDKAAAQQGLIAAEGAYLMVRPEKVRVLEEGERADFTTAGTVHAGYLLGSRRQYEIERGDQKPLIIEIVQDGSPPLADGARVRLGFDAGDTHLVERD
ncbi:ABC transporter ATP-binding protein [Jiella marina]|uniref:ABC transporter ATP-binding protein n=1 Tax=Jiella sp. LLJ827 TaxID=2917712 RepID=UPI0021010024|nr:ABC transporter ATP-binding protein [Jiella sp. LLJ827]MCQ0989778.1 ABC transporter ATP-binding protein [Jiella sp. LLJ827]